MNTPKDVAQAIAKYTGFIVEVYPPQGKRNEILIIAEHNKHRGNLMGSIVLTVSDNALYYDATDFKNGIKGYWSGTPVVSKPLPKTPEAIWAIAKF